MSDVQTTQTDVVVQQVMDPSTGELVDREDIPKVVALVRNVRDFESQMNSVKRWATEAFREWCDERAEWRHSIGGVTVTIPPPTASDIDWDLDELHKLEALLPSDRYGELVKQVVSEKPQTAKLQHAQKAGGEIGAIIERAQRRKPAKRYIGFS